MKRIGILAALFVLVACSTPNSPEVAENTPAAPQASSVIAADTAIVVSQVDGVSAATSLASHSSFNGLMVVPPQRKATITLTIGGKIHNTSLLPGEFVRQGSVIASLENPDFITLQQTFLDSYAQTEYLEAEYQRQQRLSAQEAASQKRYQQSKADYLSMKSRREAAAAQLSILGVSIDDLLKNGIRPYLEVKAPLSGYITSLDINIGKYMNAGQPICEVIDKGETLLRLTAYEKDLNDLSVGSQVQFRVNGMGTENFHATLISIGQMVDETSRSLEIYARVKESNTRFRPGMYVTARVGKK